MNRAPGPALATRIRARQLPEGIDASSYWEGHSLELPALPDGLAWHLSADTAAQPPREVYEPGREPPLDDETRVRIGARSVLVLAARPPQQRPPSGPENSGG